VKRDLLIVAVCIVVGMALGAALRPSGVAW